MRYFIINNIESEVTSINEADNDLWITPIEVGEYKLVPEFLLNDPAWGSLHTALLNSECVDINDGDLLEEYITDNKYYLDLSAIPSISPRQLRLALVSVGINISDIDVAIDSLPEPYKSKAQVSWNYASSFEINNSFVQTIANSIGLQETDLKLLWIKALQL